MKKILYEHKDSMEKIEEESYIDSRSNKGKNR